MPERAYRFESCRGHVRSHPFACEFVAASLSCSHTKICFANGGVETSTRREGAELSNIGMRP